MTERFVGSVTAAKDLSRLRAGESAAARQYVGRIIVPMNRPAGKNIEAAEKAHLLGPARQKNFKTAVIGRTDQHHRGSVARMNHFPVR